MTMYRGPQQNKLPGLLTVRRQKWTRINLIFWVADENESDIPLFMFLLSDEYT